jgi:hypothetical protein
MCLPLPKEKLNTCKWDCYEMRPQHLLLTGPCWRLRTRGPVTWNASPHGVHSQAGKTAGKGHISSTMVSVLSWGSLETQNQQEINRRCVCVCVRAHMCACIWIYYNKGLVCLSMWGSRSAGWPNKPETQKCNGLVTAQRPAAWDTERVKVSVQVQRHE